MVANCTLVPTTDGLRGWASDSLADDVQGFYLPWTFDHTLFTQLGILSLRFLDFTRLAHRETFRQQSSF